MSDELAVPISALQHYLYCPRQCALIHIERLWQESRETAEGRLLHDRANRHLVEHRHGVRTVTAMPIGHPEIGLTGVADVVEFHASPSGERAYPVEYKRGGPKRHRADEVQLCAQGICLERMFGRTVDEGALFYGRTRRRSIVVFDSALRTLTIQTTAQVRAMIIEGRTPIASYDPQRCGRCSLIEICQPHLLERGSGVFAWLLRHLKTEEQ